jgi:hypothetical protein
MRPSRIPILSAALILLAVGTQAAQAQINPGPVYGTSSAGGSGGTPTGPTNPGVRGFGTSSAGGSGGVPTGPLNPNAYGFGSSTAGGSGGIATGPTVPGLLPMSPSQRIMSDPPVQGTAYAAPGRKRVTAHGRHHHRY